MVKRREMTRFTEQLAIYIIRQMIKNSKKVKNKKYSVIGIAALVFEFGLANFGPKNLFFLIVKTFYFLKIFLF